MAKSKKDKASKKALSYGNLYTQEAVTQFLVNFGKQPDTDEVLRKAGITRHRLRVLLDDDEIAQVVETRIDALLATPLRIEPNDTDEAEKLNLILKEWFHEIATAAMSALFFGYSVQEAVYELKSEGYISLQWIGEKPMQWFEPKNDGRLITAKVAPLGYQIAFTDGANKRAYKSLNPENALYYIFDDNLWSGWAANYASICNVGLALEMTDINTISGMQCPYNPANPNQNWQVEGTGSGARPGWAKLIYGCWNHGQSSYLTSRSSGNHVWSVVGNDEGFYLIQASVSDNGNPNQVGTVNYFGKYESLNENPFNYLICANHKRNAAGDYQEVESALFSPNKPQNIYYADCKMFASKDGATSSIGVSPVFPTNGALNTFYTESKPNFTDSTGVGLIKIPFIAQQGAPIEGYLPHVYVPLLSRPLVINSMAVYAFLVEKHENGNHFIEINGLCSYASAVATLFFELKD
ncbi:phage portal protein family protein [Acinetobacter sp.]|uniref:phage portal protein family protein n=1 Tax=Acinetobacter sp. TaxID=472 RepID=UPI003BB0AA5E